MSQHTGKTYAQLTAVAAIWGGAFVSAKYALAYAGPMKLAAVRYLLATLALFPMVVHREPRALRPRAADWLPFLITGFLTIAVYQTCFFQGLRLTSSVNGALVVAANPIMTALLAAVFLGEHLRRGQWFGIALSFLGECIVVSGGRWENIVALRFNRGDLQLVVAVISWAINSLYVRRLGGRISALVLLAWSCLFGALMLLPFGWQEAPAGVPLHWHWVAIVVLLYLAVPSTAVTSIWWYDGIAQIGASRSAIFVNLVPVFAMALSFLLGHGISANQFLGAALVIAGVYLTTRKWRGAPAGTEA